MSDPPWLDRLNVVASLAGCVLCTVIASTAATVLLPFAIFAGITSVLCLLIAIPPAAAMRKRRRAAQPKPAAPTGHDPRRLAQDALDHAAKAADLGLPTGEWTDLAAFWTTWADQQDAVKAAEWPAQRPTPPKDSAGVGNAIRRWDEPFIPLSQVQRWTGKQPWLVQGEVTPGREQQVADTLTAWSLPMVTATEPPAEFGRKAAATKTATPVVRAYSTPSGAFYVHIPGYCVETFKVPPTTYRQRTDLVVINGEDCVEYRESFVAPAPGDTLLARVVMPPNTSTVQQAQITDLRASDDSA